MSGNEKQHIIEIWKSIVEVQKHFNEISMKIRGIFATILLALLAAVGFLLDKGLVLKFGCLNVQYAVLLPIFGMGGAALFYFIDRYWYHRLLVGAVKHAIMIEKKYSKELPELSLSDAIGKESSYEPRGVVRLLANILVNHEKYRETKKLHSDGKIELFYKSVILALFLISAIIAFSGGITLTNSAI